MPENEEDGIVVKTLQNNKKLLTAVSIAILVQVITFACVSYSYGYFASGIAYQICRFIALLLVAGSFVFILNKKSKPAIACTAASAAVEIIGYLLAIYLNYRGANVDVYFLVWSEFFSWDVLVEIILYILPQIMLLVFLLTRPKNVRPWAWVAALLSLLPSLITLQLLDWKYWRYDLLNGLTLCSDISLALLYYFGYTSTDTTQQTSAVKKVMASLNDVRIKMYTSIGGKIKTLAQIVCLLGIIVSVIYGICFYNTYYSVRSMGIVIIFGGSLLSWVSSFFTYGFGELIEKATVIAEAVSKDDVNKDAAEAVSKADAEKETVE